MLTIRPFTNNDMEPVIELINASADFERTPLRFTRRSFEDRLSHPAEVDPAADFLVAEMPGAGPVGYGDGSLRSDGVRNFYYVTGWVHPSFLRRGVGRALMESFWDRTQEIATERGQPFIMGARAFDNQSGAHALFQSVGMDPVRDFLIMERSLHQTIPTQVVPTGLRLETWAGARTREDVSTDRQVWAGVGEAFKDHWQFVHEPFEGFVHRTNSGQFQPEHSFLVWDEHELVGGCLNEMGPAAVERRGENIAWLQVLFVRRPWRGHGLGSALVAACLHRAAALGHEAVNLNVDAQNQTGAVGLYERQGFEVASVRTAYHRLAK